MFHVCALDRLESKLLDYNAIIRIFCIEEDKKITFWLHLEDIYFNKNLEIAIICKLLNFNIEVKWIHES